MTTDINVEALHQKRLYSILYGNPFGSQFSLESDGWSDLYKLVGNIDYVKNGWVDNKKRHRAHNPLVKIQIALQMRGDSEWQYKYRPQHIIHDELCMVLQKRAFYVTENLEVTQIPYSSLKSGHPNHIVVLELAFGPDSDPTVRGVALWFTIREEDVVMCTPQQAKRFRWKRSIKKDDDEHHSPDNKAAPSVFDSVDSFAMIRPHDSAAFDLVSDMMKHRLSVMQAERIPSMRERHSELCRLDVQKEALQRHFKNQKHDWCVWEWPTNKGRKQVDNRTPVPKVNGQYTVEHEEKVPEAVELDAKVGTAVGPIWKSFVQMSFNSNFLVDESPIDVRPIRSFGRRVTTIISNNFVFSIASKRTF
jgi:hypothetical protein